MLARAADDAGEADKSTGKQHKADEGITEEGKGALPAATQEGFTQTLAELSVHSDQGLRHLGASGMGARS